MLWWQKIPGYNLPELKNTQEYLSWVDFRMIEDDPKPGCSISVGFI